jgi:N-acetyl sugar amidotransferase
MDTTDPDITFDESGQCNHCRAATSLLGSRWLPDERGLSHLDRQIDMIRRQGRGKDFDCIIGLSGGVDSSFIAMLAHDWGLRPLVVHVDAGWNSELAVQNIEAIVNFIGADLHTHVVNWNRMRELQVAYLRAGVANQDVPQDHAFFAALYAYATRNRIKYVINGFNYATESIFPASWHGPAMDAKSLKAIQRQFGDGNLDGYPTVNMFKYYFWYPVARGMTPFHPLNFMPYSKDEAVSRLSSETTWRPYARKHGESIFTRFFQNYYLVERFGFDKRLPHLSSLIVSGQMDRETALGQLSEPLYEEADLRRDLSYICTKLRISEDELGSYINQPLRYYNEFPNWQSNYNRLKAIQSRLHKLSGRQASIYG